MEQNHLDTRKAFCVFVYVHYEQGWKTMCKSESTQAVAYVAEVREWCDQKNEKN